jgi:arylsulfatase
LTVALVGVALVAATPADAAPARRPNILVIVADDLGYSDLGAFGSEIQTPNIDRLANQGRILRNFYAQPTCSPTRSELFSGTDHHLAGVGSMLEELAPEQVGKPGYEGVLDSRVAPLSSLLRDAGYNTYLAGKWHLGGAPDHLPGARGFDRSFALLPGGASHFKQDVQRLFEEAPEPRYTENDLPVTLPDDFFSSKTYTDKLIEYIDSGLSSGKPFFAYAAYTAPHWPIQAPDSNLAKVRGRYDVGYDVIAERRFARQKVLGLAARDAEQPPLPAGIPAWSRLSPEDKVRSARTYEAYAAAVEALDDNVGRLIQHLRSRGELDDTFIVFLSDNGAEGNDLGKEGVTALPVTGQQYYDGYYGWLGRTFDNSLENIGRKNSYVFLKEAWGQTSALPNRLYKGTTTEGGVHTPAFVHYPRFLEPGKSSAIVTVRDILPTLLEVAGTRHPGIVYQGRNILPIEGTSILPYLRGSDSAVHGPGTPFGFELFGRSALRKGDWKIVRLYPPVGDGEWQLFNLAEDPAELVDLVARHGLRDRSRDRSQEAWRRGDGDRDDAPGWSVRTEPEPRALARAKLGELIRDWRAYASQNNVIELGYDFGYGWLDDSLIKP